MKNKKLILGLIGLIGLLGPMEGSQAQNGFNMPYSQFGIGLSDLPFDFPLANRMGGTIYTQYIVKGVLLVAAIAYDNYQKALRMKED